MKNSEFLEQLSIFPKSSSLDTVYKNSKQTVWQASF